MRAIVEDIAEQLNKVAEEICDSYCKYPGQHSKEEWDRMMEDDELPCNYCPVCKLVF